MDTTDEKFMVRAIELAKKGTGSVEPNPLVGCVIVKNGKIIGEGFHEKFGQAHAEINALEDCKKNDQSPKDSVIYVTLEPCCHLGKTPPCTDAIIKANPAKVVTAITDPSHHANGKGIKRLKSAGIEVEVGLCEKQAKIINAPFIKFAEMGKCWVIVKWAQSADGKMAWLDTENRRWISNQTSRSHVHLLRKRAGAILVGINTVIKDDPLLTPRPADSRKPVRVVLDTDLKIPLDCKLLSTTDQSSVIVVTTDNNSEKAELIKKTGAEVLTVPVRNSRCDLVFLLEQLGGRNISQVLVEGGAEVIDSFLKAGLADEVQIYISPEKLGDKGVVDITDLMAELIVGRNLYNVEKNNFDGDIHISAFIRNR